ncbi:MAG: hypothetical protein ABI678_32370, partial [Kofleriaceae bacterium]
GDGVPAAWTVPATGYWTTFVAPFARIGVHGSITLAPGGLGLAERTWLGGAIGLETTIQPEGSHVGYTISVDTTRVEDTSFVGVTLGVQRMPPPADRRYDVE